MAKVIVYAAQRHLDYEGDTLIDIKGTLEEAQMSAQVCAQASDGDARELEWYEDSEDAWRAIARFYEYSVTKYEIVMPTVGGE